MCAHTGVAICGLYVHTCVYIYLQSGLFEGITAVLADDSTSTSDLDTCMKLLLYRYVALMIISTEHSCTKLHSTVSSIVCTCLYYYDSIVLLACTASIVHPAMLHYISAVLIQVVVYCA
jgi:hypothetical protein